MSTSAPVPPFDWPAAGGEMAALMRATDWSATGLGSPESWSPSLKMMTRFLLVNRFPLLLWWGPDFCQLYNDAYRPILGTKHPQFLGSSVRECWSEIWHILRPLIETPFNGGPPTWMEDIELELNRYGFVEETHFTIAYSPVPDETVPTGIGGVLATVHEISEKVVNERRIVILRDLSSQAIETKTAEEASAVSAATLALHPKDVPFALLYLIDGDRQTARLAGSAGVEPGNITSPPTVSLLEHSDQVWPFAATRRSQTARIVDDLHSRFGNNVPAGPWADPPRQAVLTPIRSNISHQLAGFLIVGVSPRLKLDGGYLSFIELVAGQVATAIANARAYEEEKKRAEALAEIDRAKTTFFSNISHEFRTPLTLMIGPLEQALEEKNLPESTTEQLLVVQRNSQRLLKLVNTLLDFSRIEAGRIEATYRPTNLAAFTSDLASVFRSAIEKAGIELVVDCPTLTEPVYIDHEMWEKIVLNLVSNAFKFTFAGTIKVSLKEFDEKVELKVSDTGTGIAPEDLPHLFERFYRARFARGRSYEGSGIGLALVQELVHRHGGQVRVTSEFDRGSEFTVEIPLGKSHLPADRIEATTNFASTRLGAQSYVEEVLSWLPHDTTRQVDAVTVSSRVSEKASARILVADDNADMRDYLARLLGATYDVLAVSDGEAALDKAREENFDLVLSDVMMPRLDGEDLLKALRADDRTRSIPVILLSARAGEESRVQGLAAGADDYLVKPFSARELLARVESNLKLAKLRRDEDRRKDEFLATLAHELRNPLAPLQNGLQLLRLAGNDSATLENARSMMDRQLQQMKRLVDDLLDVSRISRNKLELRMEVTELAGIVASAIETSRPLLHAAGQELTVSLPETPVFVNADPVRISQVLSNLLNNAAKYSERGGQIQLAAKLDSDDVVVSICDSGIGIPPEELPNIFDIFVQVDRSLERSQGGLGVGLTLVQQLVRMHNGSVEARSGGLGKGSEFIVRLPVAHRKEVESLVTPKTADQVRSHGRLRVLVVDDNHDSAESLSMMIELLGHHVASAHDGLEAIELTKTFTPDVVFLDLGMPRLNGYDAARLIRQQPECADLKLVALTGWGQEEDRRRSHQAGFDEHLVKPIDFEALEKLLSSTAKN